jgi:hypothetical protein
MGEYQQIILPVSMLMELKIRDLLSELDLVVVDEILLSML